MLPANVARKKVYEIVKNDPPIKEFFKKAEEAANQGKMTFIFDGLLNHEEEEFLTYLGYNVVWNTITQWYEVSF